MKISVTVPVYRTDPKFLREMIASVLEQTFGDFELLLQDDCPEDDRESVVREFDDPRISYEKNERNLGIAGARNRLLERATGEYIAVLDHDDICRKERFEKEVAYLDAHPECGVVSSWTRLTSNGSVETFPEDDHAIKLGLMRGCCLWHPAAMIRRSLLETHGLRYEPETSPVEDYMLWMRLIPHTVFHNLPEVLLDYRWHEGNTSRVRRDRLMASDFRVKAWAKVHLPELYAEYELARTRTLRVRICGLEILKIVSDYEATDIRLLGLPLVKVAKRWKVRAR